MYEYTGIFAGNAVVFGSVPVYIAIRAAQTRFSLLKPGAGLHSHTAGCLLIAHVAARYCSGLKTEMAFGEVIFRR